MNAIFSKRVRFAIASEIICRGKDAQQNRSKNHSQKPICIEFNNVFFFNMIMRENRLIL